ncbi:mating-type switching protein swi1 [Aspergillus heteromorphus CBS 117.55]|uniref:Topoisomerase 1-associated factor 1 n=1 Tax=Aspergillus heteromorphus CBS 117.55 TaxID=1448321 RepID=A0A317UUK2_9EURO|nr:mating-type switching protein swi1 [Aspergillus heteromorphus CBS 117.55]PWY64758.1 mating-type switching protein swi1 [Aspergillus heteromorphus CBS 117.55]
MEGEEEPVLSTPDVQVVDPDVRAHVYSLVTALGGFNGEDADKYMLGDDALACLRDIKRWLKLYDEKHNRMDVARCLGEANLINGDLLPILSVWATSGKQTKYMSRIALACLELLVPLTWPLEIHGEMTFNHHRHIPYLQHVHVAYKRGLLSHAGTSYLRTIIRIGLPSMAVTRSERTTRDEGILKLLLYLLRNLALITPNTRLAAEGDEEETSRSATINAFQDQDVFALLLTMCSNVGDDFSMQDVTLLEILFHLIRGVNVEKLFMDDAQRTAKRTDELGDLLQQESSIRREYAKNAPTRHGRFGTMIWVKRDDAKYSTVSGQNVLKDSQATLQKMDESKKWNKPQFRRKPQDLTVHNDFSTPAHLNSTASSNLRMFVEEFLDSGFNPLLTHVRKAIEREADRVVDINTRQFLYTVAWFLEAERARRARQRKKHSESGKSSKGLEPDSFGLVAGVLNQETFVFLNRAMQYALDHKDWQDLIAGMRCFTQILLTVQDMAQSPLEEDQEIAENIQNRIFYEETTHDRVLAIIRGYTDQGFGYLDACTELTHVFLRMLERYSKENADMQVRSRRRAKRKAKEAEEADNNGGDDEERASEDEDLMEAERVSKERKFDFRRFTARFCNQKCVDTFVAFTKHYNELNTEQLKRAHRYFYRIAFKQEMSVLLFRLDIVNLFYRIIKGPGALDSSKPIFKEWEELVRQIIRRLVKRLEERPALFVELLFSKINSTTYYLEYGHERQTLPTAKRAPAELEIDPRQANTMEEKISIVVPALVLDGETDLVKWISEVLGSAVEDREAWEAQEKALCEAGGESSKLPNPMIAVKPRDDSIQEAMFGNAKLRLLMTLLKFERLGMTDVSGTSWVITATPRAQDLREMKEFVDKYLDKATRGTLGRDPRELIRRKFGPKKGNDNRENPDINFGSDSEGEDEVPDGPLFAPNPRAQANASKETKKKKKKNKRKARDEDDDEEDADESVDEEALEERRRARLENTRARLAKIKSDLYVHASDEESDEEADKEFFLLEEQRRKDQAHRVKKALLTGRTEEADSATGKKGQRKGQTRRRNSQAGETQSKRQRRETQISDDDEDEDILMGGVDVSSPRLSRAGTPTRDVEDDLIFDDDLAFSRDREKDLGFPGAEREKSNEPGAGARAEDEDEDAPVAAAGRRRMRAGFVVDSDSE